MNNSSVQIEKLDRSNYDTWKFQMQMVLIQNELWDCIEGEIPEVIHELTKWQRKDKKALATIVLSMKPSELNYVKKCTSAKEAWLKIKEIYQPQGPATKVSLMKKLLMKKQLANESMQDHLNTFFGVVDKLNEIGSETPDEFLCILLLCSLSEDYENFRIAIETRDALPELSTLKVKILEEESRRKEKDTESMKNIVQGVLKTKVTSNSKNERFPFKCNYCGVKGHKISDCWKKRNKIVNSSSIKTQPRNRNQIANKIDENPNLIGNKDEVCFTLIEDLNSNNWHIDSGASSHMCCNRELFTTFNDEIQGPIQVADGRTIKYIGKGDVRIMSVNNIPVTIKDVLYSPNINGNLLSVNQLTNRGLKVVFEGNMCEIMKDTNTVGIGDKANGLYKLRLSENALMISCCYKNNCIHKWHKCFGHRDMNAIRKLQSDNLVTDLEIDSCDGTSACETCLEGKMTRLPYPKKSLSTTRNVLDLIHTDLCGPFQTPTPRGNRYVLTLIDDYSRYTIIYLLQTKDQAAARIEDFILYAMNKFEKPPKIIRSDRGGEYTGKVNQDLLRKYGIEMQLTAPYSHQQNGVAERKNRTLMDSVRCMLIESKLSNKYWGEAIWTANYLQNRLPTEAKELTPFELFNDTKPKVSHLHVFGEKCFVHVPDVNRRKLDPKSIPRIFVGYDSKAYRLLDPSTDKITISRDVKFTNKFFFEITKNENEEKLISEAELPILGNCEDLSDEDEEFEPLDQPTRVSSRSNKGKPPERLIETCSFVTEEPRTYKEAISSPEKEKWIKAMKEEIESMSSNEVWNLVELPHGRKAIGGKWVFKKKFDESGNVSRYKARYVAKGFSQKYGEDYNEVFAPVAKQTTFRTLLTVAGKHQMHVKHFDIKTAFLNGDIEEDLYMVQPEGFSDKNQDHLVCKLNKSIYGLKQSARAWNTKLNKILIEDGFIRSNADYCLYSKQEEENWVYIIVYVDDLIIASKAEKQISRIREKLETEFEVSDLGDLKFYLGINIVRDANKIFSIHQKTYICKILERFGLQDAKISNIPLDPGYEKRKEENSCLTNNLKYRSALGALLYISNFTRPDIAVAVSILSRRISNPTEADWTEVKRVLRYLKGSADLKLMLGNPTDNLSQSKLIGYADANWANDSTDRKSNSGNLFQLFGATISWSSKKQQCVSLSSTEAEYVSFSEACQEGIWLTKLLKDFNLQIPETFLMFEDNQSCLKLLDNNKTSTRTKHIDTKFHFVRDLKVMGKIDFEYCPTENMLADILTKPLEKIKIQKFLKYLGLK